MHNAKIKRGRRAFAKEATIKTKMWKNKDNSQFLRTHFRLSHMTHRGIF
jgi:hypothetical protein